MPWELLSVLGIGLLLGFRHAFDPDHFIAVSTITSRTGNVLKATVTGIYWGLGHTLTLLLVGMPFIALKTGIPSTVETAMEVVVGLMLVLLGWTTFRSFQQRRTPDFEEAGKSEKGKWDSDKKTNLKSFLIGVVHGMAGSGALVLLTMTSLESLTEAVLYILVFGSGTILGMGMFAVLLGFSFTYAAKRFQKAERVIGMAAGAVSFLFGFYYIQAVLF
ncbi:urease accessory protein UreH domain-containing protein [Paludifilum halophilum]|uniref:Urease accessory protein UreH-like transmembrane domain-containing protein n=1 Tax=Paludifilum halophilum TaxID=1642702 RepID=A0A235B929_9BACL|nr:sulfite exporter TauE/SafE family protein [Paludifilum halophilum]OYD08810.1 hypothetical protein CHM34_03170 [Paludifilum halophilum]